MSTRTLQRLFRRHVGVGPKWVLGRYRLHAAAEQLAAGERHDWTTLALDLGYFDHAHFIRDFSAVAGRSPAEYEAQCAALAARREPAPAQAPADAPAAAAAPASSASPRTTYAANSTSPGSSSAASSSVTRTGRLPQPLPSNTASSRSLSASA